MSLNSGITSEENSETGRSTTDNGEGINKDILNMINCPTILTGMSHEMRTHMNSIVAFSFLMNNGDCCEGERKEYTNQILSSCEQLMGLFDNFLDSAIIDTGNSKAEPRSCNLGNLLNDLLSEFRVIMKREDHKDLVLILENQANKQSEVLIDSNRVSRVIRGLFQNALHNTGSGYIKIGYYFRDGNVVFYVLDSGNGYQKCSEFLNSSNLNESLRLHDDTSSAINLTLARKLISLMEGTIWVESNGPAGTGLYFSVPAREVDAPKVTLNQYNNTRIAI